MKKMLQFAALALLISTITYSDTFAQKGFSVEEARKYAVEHNYTVKNARIDNDIAKKKIWETTAIGLPQVKANLDYTNFLEIPTSLIPGEFFPPPDDVPPGYVHPEFIELQFGTKHNATYGFTISQLLFNGSYLVGLQTSRIYKQLSVKNLEKTELDVQETVTNTYYLILLAEENKRLLDSTLANLRRIDFEINALYNEGFVEESDVDQMTLNVSNVTNLKNSLENQINLAYRLLKFQMGIELNEEIVLKENLDDIVQKVNYSGLSNQNFDVKSHIDYQILTAQERMLFMNMKNEQAQLLPTLAAFYNQTENAQRQKFNFFSGDENWFPTKIVGVTMEIPVFGSGQKLSKISQAKKQLDQIRNSKLMLEEGLQLKMSQAKTELSTAYNKFLAEQKSVNISKKIYDKSFIKFKEGLISSTELTQQQNQYISAQSNYIQALSELLTAKNKLDKILENY